MPKVYKWFIRISTALLLIGLVGAMVILALSYDASSEALAIKESSDVRLEDSMYILEPNNAKANIIIYQGGLVQTEAYLVLADLLKDQGFRVFVPKMPLNLAIINRNIIIDIVNDYPSELPWIGLGHSLGGASLAYGVLEANLDALIFLASYPPESIDLSESELAVLSITASNDLILDLEVYESAKKLLPLDTRYEIIVGGNHANFGFYGKQRNDGEASITNLEQHQLVVSLINDFINNSIIN
jgi:hypothetical protein